ncbi:MAG: hypothetical protein LBM07_03065 [Culturomica sp.]|jgi:hypothetical protein|nr:hypothetical protein [Culturomica sp.]
MKNFISLIIVAVLLASCGGGGGGGKKTYVRSLSIVENGDVTNYYFTYNGNEISAVSINYPNELPIELRITKSGSNINITDVSSQNGDHVQYVVQQNYIRKSISDETDQTNYNYTNLNELLQIVYPDGGQDNFTWVDGNIKSIRTDPENTTVTYQYGAKINNTNLEINMILAGHFDIGLFKDTYFGVSTKNLPTSNSNYNYTYNFDDHKNLMGITATPKQGGNTITYSIIYRD